jgi:hypothetical protein
MHNTQPAQALMTLSMKLTWMIAIAMSVLWTAVDQLHLQVQPAGLMHLWMRNTAMCAIIGGILHLSLYYILKRLRSTRFSH